MKRLLFVLVVAALALGVQADAAGAHAVLRSSEPQDRQVLSNAPARVLLRFSESVALSNSSVRVLDQRGAAVVEGAAHLPGDDAQVEVRLPGLVDGTYVATWRLVSSDSHAIVGAITFQVGAATKDAQLDASALAKPKIDRTVGGVFGVVRFAQFSSVILLAGSVAFLLFLWPAGRARRGPRRLVAAAWLASVATTIAAVGLQGAYVSGGGLADATSRRVIADVLTTRFGHAALARLALLVGAALVLALGARARRAGAAPRLDVQRPAVVVALLALILSISWVGHASTGRFVTAGLALDVTHLAAASVWLGGLVMLVSTVLRRRDDEEPGAAEDVVARFSKVAFGAVVVIVATGSLQSWRQLDGPGQLTSTTFGRLLLVKIALTATILVAASFSRRLVRSPAATPALALSFGPGAAARAPVDPLPRLRRWVLVEVGIALLVIAVTAALVNTVPARSAEGNRDPAQPFTTDLAKDGVRIFLTLDPARTGRNALQVHVIAQDGKALDPLKVSATLRLAAGDTGSLEVPLVENVPGHWTATGFPISIAGAWELEVAVLVTEIDLVRFRADLPIRP